MAFRRVAKKGPFSSSLLYCDLKQTKAVKVDHGRPRQSQVHLLVWGEKRDSEEKGILKMGGSVAGCEQSEDPLLTTLAC